MLCGTVSLSMESKDVASGVQYSDAKDNMINPLK
jgi:hypothetical protein